MCVCVCEEGRGCVHERGDEQRLVACVSACVLVCMHTLTFLHHVQKFTTFLSQQ